MKYTILILFFLLGCSTYQEKDYTDADEQMLIVDSAIIESQKNLIFLDSTSRSTDSLISQRVYLAMENMSNMKQQIDSFKNDKIKINSVEKFVYRIDTVYIETKKNFWGREKTSKRIKSDSTTFITTDSSSEFIELTDTLKIIH